MLQRLVELIGPVEIHQEALAVGAPEVVPLDGSVGRALDEVENRPGVRERGGACFGWLRMQNPPVEIPRR